MRRNAPPRALARDPLGRRALSNPSFRGAIEGGAHPASAPAMRSRGRWLVGLIASAPCVACSPFHPPFTQASHTHAEARPHQAIIVFLWPVTSCDPAGYLTLVSADGRFVGNVAAGTQLRAEVPAGETTIVGWNEVREEAGGAGSGAVVPVLRAHLTEGRTYFVRMLFGKWDERGPREPIWVGSRSRAPYPLCTAIRGPAGVTSAMVTLAPGTEGWKEVPDWTAKLQLIAPDRAAGQAWLDGQGEAARAHIAVGMNRYEGLRAEARRMATVEAEDGVPTVR
jgi:hypothetical protein